MYFVILYEIFINYILYQPNMVKAMGVFYFIIIIIIIIIISSILSSSNSEQLQSKTSCRDPKEEGKPTLTASEF